MSDIPIKSSGTIASPGPSEIVSVTDEPALKRVVASGFWLATRSRGITPS